MENYFSARIAILLSWLCINNQVHGFDGIIKVTASAVTDVTQTGATFTATIEHISGGDPYTSLAYFYVTNDSGFAKHFDPNPEAFALIEGRYNGWKKIDVEINIDEVLEPNTDYTMRFSLLSSGDDQDWDDLRGEVHHFKTLPKGGILTTEVRSAIEKTPERPTYESFPELEELGENVKNLVIVTHGWRGGGSKWMGNMVKSINAYLKDNGLSTWRAHDFNWEKKAEILKRDGGPVTALYNGKSEGSILGIHIASLNLDHVHLIAHSAGAGLIQAACDAIKLLSPNTTVHLTFLDPFVGLNDNERKNYGKGADWADNYFARDLKTSLFFWEFTEGVLPNAHNIDITFLDPNGVISTVDNQVTSVPCTEKNATHAWPYQFYEKSIGAETGFGFHMSKEGGNWDTTLSNYDVGNDPALVLGTPDTPCNDQPAQVAPPEDRPVIGDFVLSHIASTTGVVDVNRSGLIMTTGSPVWIAATLKVADVPDHITFEAEFITQTSNGLLTVYWNNDVIGKVDERATLPGVRKYSFFLAKPATEGVLSFRLDSFSDDSSSIKISNPVLSISKPNIIPFQLDIISVENNTVLLNLTGPIGLVYIIQSTSDLTNWNTNAIIENTNGGIMLSEQVSQSAQLFYRAILP